MAKFKKINYGFSIVELLISMMLGAFLINTVMHLYIEQTVNYKISEQALEVEYDTQFVSDLIARDIRAAGDFGCFDLSKHQLLLRNPVLNADNEIVKAFPNIGAVPLGSLGRARLAGLNPIGPILMLKGAYGAQTKLALNMPTSDAVLQVDTVANFNKGDIAIISNCLKSTIFEITGLIGTDQIEHTNIITTTGSAGNNTSDIYSSTTGSTTYNSGAMVAQLDFIYYAICQPIGGRPKGLYRVSATRGLAHLVSNKVDQWVLKFQALQHDANPSLNLRRFEITDIGGPITWQDVASVEYEFLFKSTREMHSLSDAEKMQYTFNGVKTTALDKRYYMPMRSSSRLRNMR